MDTQTPEGPTRVSRKELGARIHGRRVYLDLTQEQLGAKVGVDGSVISKIEAGKRDMTVEFFGRLCPELGVTEPELLYERLAHAGVVQSEPVAA